MKHALLFCSSYPAGHVDVYSVQKCAIELPHNGATHTYATCTHSHCEDNLEITKTKCTHITAGLKAHKKNNQMNELSSQ